MPSTILEKNENVFVIKDINPISKTHLLIMPTKHIVNMKHFDFSADKETMIGMYGMVQHLSKKLIGPQKAFTINCNNEINAGQSVFHLHWHFLSDEIFRH
jgi:histidine triad (HIT) family protein